MRLSPNTCPTCQSQGKHQLLGHKRYPSSALPLAGGPLIALIFELSRKRRFRCGNCQSEFYTHTIGSRFFLAFWILFLASVILAILAIVLQIILHPQPS
ncbi:hypothetical protein Cflav_PD6245 [Pedosphaera parvula Ellin514]|uniref:Uncharacterized protein n=1 Tax=Pedosphaera parvula (strain Ellin514) TaxID=320771 RepID=B9XHS6_PEDPL|nr:hypothetical protein Cflav_PD6245 [Pedosphaera parvula Ellin514]